MPRSRATRALRGTLAASAATFFALVSHVTAGGDMPGWVGLAVPWVLSVALCTLLAGRALSFVRLSLAVAASQMLFHTLFVLGMFGGEAASAPAAHDHASMGVLSMAPIPAMQTDSTMWVWHGIAAVATIAVIYRGERAARRVLAVAGDLGLWLLRRILLIDVAPTPALAPRVPVFHAPLTITPLGWHPSAVGRRGPPLLHAI